jgi:small subunit ribosomal protein S16
MVVQEANRHPLSGRVVAYLGSYNPHTKETVLDKESAERYLGNGAQPSSRVVKVLKTQGVKLPKWVKDPAQKERAIKNQDKLRKNRPAGPVEEAAPEPETPAEDPAVEAPAEAPAEETPAEEPAAE